MLAVLVFFLQAALAHAQAQWQLVDAAAVVCPPLATVPSNFSVSFSLDQLQQDQPYILTWIRASTNQVSITYKVTDNQGLEIVPVNQVTLAALSPLAPAPTCKCLPATLPGSVAATFGANYGSQCAAWDNTNCGLWWGATSVGDWCCQPWCFASSSCPDAFPSDLVPGAFISYSACSSSPPAVPCRWTTVAKMADPCACVNVDKSFNVSQLALLGPGYGSSCMAWDSSTCARDNDPWSLGSWCCESWCYVNASCPSAQYSYARGMNGTLPWSSATCVSDPQTVAQCPMVTPDQSCKCLNVTMPAAQLPAGAASDFGQTCKIHNSNLCQQGSNRGIWCCLPWCWVSPMCPYKYASTDWPGQFYSPQNCDADPQVLATCPYSTACRCQAAASAAGQPPFPQGLPANYGSSCGRWDAGNCNATWGNTTLWASSSLDWCCDTWCFVDPSCPLSEGTRNTLLGTRTFSTAACNDPRNLTYQLSNNSCVPVAASARRLETLPPRSQAEQEDLLETPPKWRELRGRSGGSSRGGFTSTRTTSPRRRSPARSSPPPPPPPRTPVASPRRRAPRWTGSVASDVRRRTTALGRSSGFSVAKPRPPGQSVAQGTPVNYGYTSKGQLLQNYGRVPYQTPYGFSGYGAYPASYRPNVALGAGVGLAAGAAVGFMAGSYYMAYANSAWRRRIEWCVVPGTGSFMECWDCNARYGACLKASACFSNAGCGLQLPSAMNRDDLAATGFIPSDWASPITVTIVNITGLNTTGLCPTNVNGSFTLRPELFLTLTQQQILGTATSCEIVLGTPCNTTCFGSNQVCIASTEGRRSCVCQDGSCVSGSGFSATCVTTRASTSMSDPTTPAWLAIFLLALIR